jgi:long-chain acyl-CoA synthetase
MNMDKNIYLSIMAAVATTAAVWLFALLAAPVAKPLAWALIIGIATIPYHDRFVRKFPHHPNRAAGLMVLAVTVCFILPAATLIVLIAQNATAWYAEGERLVLGFTAIGTDTLNHFPFAAKIFTLKERFGVDISGFGAKLTAAVSAYLLAAAKNTALNLGELLFTLAVALFILFFIYRDGERILSAAINRFASDRDKARYYCSEIRATTTAVTVGTLFTCFVQGITAGLGYFAAGVPAPFLCGALTALAALVPVVGTGIVWVPLAALVAINGAYLKAGLLVLWCVFFVGLADNAIRPLAIGAKSSIPVPAIVLGAIGGVFALGVLGLILGPVLFAILITVWHDVTGDGQPAAPHQPPSHPLTVKASKLLHGEGGIEGGLIQGAPMQTLIDLFKTFEALGAKTAFVNRTGVRRLTVSYGEFHDLSLKMANLLAHNGVAAGDKVLLWGPNSSWWAVAYWGIILRGAIAVPVDFMSDPARAESIRGLTRAGVVLQSRYKAERITAETSILLEDLQYLLEEMAPIDSPASPLPDDTAQLIYTSGTTGNPKGVILTHKNLIANMTQINRQVPIITPEFSFLSLLPLSHMFEQMGGFFTPLYRGATIVYLRTLKPSAIMEALSGEDIYVIMSVPRLMQLLKTTIERELEEKHLSGLFRSLAGLSARLPKGVRRRLFYPVQKKFGANFTVFVSGGAPLDPDVFTFWNSMGFTVLEGYGLTETSPVLCVNTMERQVAGSVGPPLPGVEVKIEEKEVLARGDNVFPGYYENEQASRDAFTEDGWFRTGDIGELDPDGWLIIKGREKDLIVTGSGVNVYPDELEAVLNKTAGVKEACVIGIDRGSGEEVHAVLIPDGSGVAPDAIIAQANISLDTLHRITGYTLWNEPEFPKTTTLKIKKFEVREEVLKGAEGGDVTVSRDSLLNLLARVTGTDAAQIREESLLVADLGLTSIDRLELVNFLEQEYRLDIEDSQVGPQTRVSDLRTIIAKREKVTRRDHFRFWTNARCFRGVRMVWDNLCHFPLLRSFVTLEVRGREHVEQLDGPVYFVANHLSYFDQPSIMLALPPKIRYRCATAAWEEFFFGDYHGFSRIWRSLSYEFATLLFNLFPLPQTRGFGGSLKYMGRLADDDFNILIFPEGGHSKDGTMQPFQLGLGIMVKELGIPVVPIKISGTREVLPPGSSVPKRGKVTVTFGTPLRFRYEEPAEIVGKTRQAVENL